MEIPLETSVIFTQPTHPNLKIYNHLYTPHNPHRGSCPCAIIKSTFLHHKMSWELLLDHSTQRPHTSYTLSLWLACLLSGFHSKMEAYWWQRQFLARSCVIGPSLNTDTVSMKKHKNNNKETWLFAILKTAERGRYSFTPWPGQARKPKGTGPLDGCWNRREGYEDGTWEKTKHRCLYRLRSWNSICMSFWHWCVYLRAHTG